MFALYINIDDLTITNQNLTKFSSLLRRLDATDFKSIFMTLLLIEKSIYNVIQKSSELSLEAGFETLLTMFDSNLRQRFGDKLDKLMLRIVCRTLPFIV